MSACKFHPHYISAASRTSSRIVIRFGLSWERNIQQGLSLFQKLSIALPQVIADVGLKMAKEVHVRPNNPFLCTKPLLAYHNSSAIPGQRINVPKFSLSWIFLQAKASSDIQIVCYCVMTSPCQELSRYVCVLDVWCVLGYWEAFGILSTFQNRKVNHSFLHHFSSRNMRFGFPETPSHSKSLLSFLEILFDDSTSWA